MFTASTSRSPKSNIVTTAEIEQLVKAQVEAQVKEQLNHRVGSLKKKMKAVFYEAGMTTTDLDKLLDADDETMEMESSPCETSRRYNFYLQVANLNKLNKFIDEYMLIM